MEHLVVGGLITILLGVFFVLIGRVQRAKRYESNSQAENHWPQSIRDQVTYYRWTTIGASAWLFTLTGLVFLLVGVILVIVGAA